MACMVYYITGACFFTDCRFRLAINSDVLLVHKDCVPNFFSVMRWDYSGNSWLCFCWHLTHWGRDKMAAVSQTTFSYALSRISNIISLKFVLRGQINNIPALAQIMAWHRPGAKPLSKPVMVRSPTLICVTWPQWVKHTRVVSLNAWQANSG